MNGHLRAEIAELLEAFSGALVNGFEGPEENWEGYDRRVGVVLACLELETELEDR